MFIYITGAHLCHYASLDLLNGFKYTHKVGFSPDKMDGDEYFEETLEFDLPKEDPVSGKTNLQLNVVVYSKHLFIFIYNLQGSKRKANTHYFV